MEEKIFNNLRPGVNTLLVHNYNKLVDYINEKEDVKIIKKSPLGYWFIFERKGEKIGVTYEI